MLRSGRPEAVDTTSLRTYTIAGGPISESHLIEMRELLPGTFVSQGYGQSEVAGTLSFFKTKYVKETLMLHHKPTSVGTPLPGINYKVMRKTKFLGIFLIEDYISDKHQNR